MYIRVSCRCGAVHMVVRKLLKHDRFVCDLCRTPLMLVTPVVDSKPE